MELEFVGTGNCTDPCVCISPKSTETSTSPVPFVAEQDIPTNTGAEEKPRKASLDPGRNVVKHRCQERPNGDAIAKDEVLSTI